MYLQIVEFLSLAKLSTNENQYSMITKKISKTLKYNPKTEKEYCCVPAVLQMIQEGRGFEFVSQDEIDC